MITENRRAALASVAATAIGGIALLSGCAGDGAPATATGDAATDSEFAAWNRTLMIQVEADPWYRRLPIDTDAQALEFETRLHEAYRKQISAADFTAWANRRYPGSGYEIAFIAERLPR